MAGARTPTVHAYLVASTQTADRRRSGRRRPVTPRRSFGAFDTGSAVSGGDHRRDCESDFLRRGQSRFCKWSPERGREHIRRSCFEFCWFLFSARLCEPECEVAPRGGGLV